MDRDVSGSLASQSRQAALPIVADGGLVSKRVLTKPAVGKEAGDTQGADLLGRWPAIPHSGAV